jgi:hypothetical protein
MRVRGAVYGLLIVVAAVLGIVAAGIPARGGSANARIVTPPPSTTAPKTTTTVERVVSTTTTTVASAHTPAQVTVLVANGSGTVGAAAKVTKLISDAGYTTLTAVDANNRSTPATTVYYGAGYHADAVALAGLIGAPVPGVQPMPLPVPVSSLESANVLIVLGADRAH